MSQWADFYLRWTDELHTVPIEFEKLPVKHLKTAAFGHVPFIECHCKPHVRLSECGEYMIVNHRDPERGSMTDEGETLQ